MTSVLNQFKQGVNFVLHPTTGTTCALLALFARMTEAELLAPEHAGVIRVVASVSGVLEAIDAAPGEPALPAVSKW